MSGYGGVPPSGWEDPYGGSQDWGGGYGPPGGHAYGPGTQPPGAGYGYGPPGVPYTPASSGSSIAALVCNIVAVALCCNIFAIPGVITAALAVSRVHGDPASARRLTAWSWCLLAASIVLGIIAAVLYLVVMANSRPDYGSSPDGI
ncbi:hypothetical protein [Actinomadura roseirufa]|uniref:hypothetical protein n=1 Tax=Actinomadura roseirufa TaxID=2094049 RepID=UPI001041780A|nr:hypothetical protein [Actinomadura roseirufa]